MCRAKRNGKVDDRSYGENLSWCISQSIQILEGEQ